MLNIIIVVVTFIISAIRIIIGHCNSCLMRETTAQIAALGGEWGGGGGECGKRTMRGLGDTMEGGVWCRGRHLTAYDAERERLP